MKIVSMLKAGTVLLSKHKSVILTGIGVVSAVGATILGVKATIEACKQVEEMKKEAAVETKEDLNDGDETVKEKKTEKATKLDKINILKKTWKNYIPVVISLGLSIACVICAHHVDAKRIAAVTAALMASEKMNQKLEEELTRHVNVDGFKDIKNKIFRENPDIEANRAKASKDKTVKEMMVDTPTYPKFHDEECWFKDELTGRTFRSTRNQIEKAILDATKDGMNARGDVSLNAIYDLIGIDECYLGDRLGWDAMNQDIGIGSYEPDMMENGAPGLIIHWLEKPVTI